MIGKTPSPAADTSSAGPHRAPEWRRPVPVIGDTTSARQRAIDPTGWAFPAEAVSALDAVIAGRRDIRRFRPDPVADELVREVVSAGHLGPSVGHSQPWRFIVVNDAGIRDRAAAMADSLRLEQAAGFAPDRAQHLLDLKLEGLREAPLGIVVACDRRTPAAGVLGRATFPDADLWSCACAIENMWLKARALGLGMGWVTLFRPDDLAELLHLPQGVESLGWLCLGWPDERPPEPGLERLAWSRRLPLDEILMYDAWPTDSASGSGSPEESRTAPPPPPNHLYSPDQASTVAATDDADELLCPPGALGTLDRALDRLVASGAGAVAGGTLVLVGADHPVTGHGVSAYPPEVTREVMCAAVAGQSLGAVCASGAGLATLVVDAGVDGGPVPGAVDLRADGVPGDLMTSDALPMAAVHALVEGGRRLGAQAAASGLVVLGEVGVGNTTVASALACALLGLDADEAVGLGSASDSAVLAKKAAVVRAALSRMAADGRLGDRAEPQDLLAGLGGPEFAVLTGVVLGAAGAGAGVVLDGLAGSIPAVLARRMEPGVHGYLVAGQRSRERAHTLVLRELGVEPILSLRFRAGEGVGACLSASVLLQGLAMRRSVARTR